MTKLLTTLFCLLPLTSVGQRSVEKAFNPADYPSDTFSIQADTFYFSDFQIELHQAKLRHYKMYTSTTPNCRIWLTVKKGDRVVDKLFLHDCEALGGCSGIYASRNQARKDYFILSKFGDYDGRILIIDTSGTIKSYLGGHYFISMDNSYLFSLFSSDAYGLTVYDLSNNRVLFSSDTLNYFLSDFYYINDSYFALVGHHDKETDRREIVTFDFKTNTLIRSTVDTTSIKKAKQLTVYNQFKNAPCSCGRTK